MNNLETAPTLRRTSTWTIASRSLRAALLVALCGGCGATSEGSPATGQLSPAQTGAAAGRAGSAAATTAPKAGERAAAGAKSEAGSGGARSDTARAGAAGMPDGGRSGGAALDRFSFFVTSLRAMRDLSGSQQGFGGDLRFGKANGLEGADEICRRVAERSMPGSGDKRWRAFLSATALGPDGGPVHAIDRVGEGPWYDRLGRLVAMNKLDLAQFRPRGADPVIVDDLPNEDGLPNHSDGAMGCSGGDCPDNHMVLTGSDETGRLRGDDPGFTCNDWSSAQREGSPWCGASWPRGSRGNWMSYAADSGCAPCVEIEERGGPKSDERCVGSAGGYGAIYCLALTP